jgi:hypothetical protein
MIYYEAQIKLPSTSGSGEVLYSVDRGNIVSLDVGISDRSDNSAPSFGIISNTGRIDFIDNKSVSILQYAKSNLLKSNFEVKCFLKNSQIKINDEPKSETVATMLTSSWSYDTEDKVVSVSIKDFLEEWQEIEVAGTTPEIEADFSGNALSLYKDLIFLATPDKYRSLFQDLDSHTEEHLASIQDNIGAIEPSTLWGVWERFCIATQTHLVVGSEGKIVVRYNGGN